MIVRQNLLLKYKKTFFGVVWSLINPLVLMTTTAVIFSSVFKMDLVDFTVYMFVGMTLWSIFSNSVIQGAGSIVGNEGLIKKIKINRWIFPVSATLSSTIETLPMLTITYLMANGVGVIDFLGIIKTLPVIVMLFVFSLGLAIGLSAVTVYLRDLQYITSIALQVWFYATPILYKTSMLGNNEEVLLKLNPVANYLVLFRECEIGVGSEAARGSYSLGIFYCVLSLVVGVLVFLKLDKNLVKNL